MTYLEPVPACLQAKIVRLDREIQALIRASADLRHDTEILTAMVGISPVTAAALFATMPELGILDRHQAATLAPHPCQAIPVAAHACAMPRLEKSPNHSTNGVDDIWLPRMGSALRLGRIDIQVIQIITAARWMKPAK